MKKIITFGLILLVLTSCVDNTENKKAISTTDSKTKVEKNIEKKGEKKDNKGTVKIKDTKKTIKVKNIETAGKKPQIKKEITNKKTPKIIPQPSIQTAPLEEGDIVATIKTTQGDIKIKLFPKIVPNTANNFIGLAQKEYYKDVTFHRVIQGFMIQGGDPDGTGKGGESIYGGNFNDEFSDKLSNIPYSISMANSGPNTNGSQFFINQGKNMNLDYNKQPLASKHAVFGQVIEGKNVVDTIAGVKVDAGERPVTEVKMLEISITQFKNKKLEAYTLDAKKVLTKYQEEKNKRKTKKLEKKDTVSVHYTLTVEGKKLDSSIGGKPFTFTLGNKEVIPGWDKGLLGHKVGDKFKLEVTAKDAYGEYDKTKVDVVPRARLKAFEEKGIILKAGNKIPTQRGEFTILKATDKEITIDVNHQLAGKKLFFEIEVMDIK